MRAKTIEEYLKLPYTIEVIRDTNEENPGWVARVVELPGCITQSDTFDELETMIQDAMRLWIEVALEDGTPIPEPRSEEEYSGKFIVRVPKSLHRRMAVQADREGVSLNQFVSTVLAGAVGVTQPASSLGPLPFSKGEIRSMIREEIQQAVREIVLSSVPQQVEEKRAVSKEMVLLVKEPENSLEYERFLKEADWEKRDRPLTSPILDSLAE